VAVLALEVGLIADTIIAAGRGEAYDTTWNQTGEGDGIQTTTPETIAAVVEFGGPFEPEWTSLEIESSTILPNGHRTELRAIVVVFPTGEIRLGRTRMSERNRPEQSQGLSDANPALAAAGDWMVESLRSCEVAGLTQDDFGGVVDRRLMQRRGDWSDACANVTALGDTDWVHSVKEVTVSIRNGDERARLRSEFELEDGRLTLTRVRYRQRSQRGSPWVRTSGEDGEPEPFQHRRDRSDRDRRGERSERSPRERRERRHRETGDDRERREHDH